MEVCPSTNRCPSTSTQNGEEQVVDTGVVNAVDDFMVPEGYVRESSCDK